MEDDRRNGNVSGGCISWQQFVVTVLPMFLILLGAARFLVNEHKDTPHHSGSVSLEQYRSDLQRISELRQEIASTTKEARDMRIVLERLTAAIEFLKERIEARRVKDSLDALPKLPTNKSVE